MRVFRKEINPMSETRSLPRRILSGLWNGVTRVRTALANVLFLAIIIALVFAFRGAAPPPLPEKAALLLNPTGTVVEEKTYIEPFALLFREPLPQEREVLLADIIEAIELAADDPRITSLVMSLDDLLVLDSRKAAEIAGAIAEFRASGKPVAARGAHFGQGQYLLAAQADTLSLHPLGGVLLFGMGYYPPRIAAALEKLSVTTHVFQAGDNKSFAEVFKRSDMSPGEKAITQRWLDSIWGGYTDAVEERRELAAGSIDRYIAGLPDGIAASGGDLAQLALLSGLVDRVETREEALEWLNELVGEVDDDGFFAAVEFEEYAARARMENADGFGSEAKVGVIYATGGISTGEQPPGAIGSESLSRRLQEAIDDEQIAAVVLRVDSGGGSAQASEYIREKVLEVKAAGKPVVVSMSSVAASGGYWIAASADEIWAMPGTLTGSIGVFAMIPTIERGLNRLGINYDGAGTTEFATAGRPHQPFPPRLAPFVQGMVDGLHHRFVDLIAESRNMARARAGELATGTVWTGADALELGLVDQLGGLQGAIDAAAKLAGIEEGYDTVRLQELPSPWEAFLLEFAGSVGAPLAGLLPAGMPGLAEAEALRAASERAGMGGALSHARMLLSLDDPQGIYAYCLSCAAPGAGQ